MIKKKILLALTFCMFLSCSTTFAAENPYDNNIIGNGITLSREYNLQQSATNIQLSSEKILNISDKIKSSITTNKSNKENNNKNDDKNKEKTEDIIVAIEKAELRVGEEVSITVDKEVEFSSSDSSVVIVDKKGKVTAIGEGTADVIIKYGDASEKIEFTVKAIPYFDVKIPDFLEIGKTEKITIETDHIYSVEYSSSNPEIIEVNKDGNVTVLKKEKAEIQVKMVFEDSFEAIEIIKVEPSNIIEANAEQSHKLCEIIITLLLIIAIGSNAAIYYNMKKDKEMDMDVEE